MRAPATIIHFPTSVEAQRSAGQAVIVKSFPDVSRPRGIRGRWQTAWECLPIIPAVRDYFHQTQAMWDAENAIAPMPVDHPSAAGIIGGGLLVLLNIGIFGAWLGVLT